MHSTHRLFGLTVRSNVPVPGLPVLENSLQPADLEMHLGTGPSAVTGIAEVQEELAYTSASTDTSGNPGLRIWRSAHGRYLRLAYYDGMQFWLESAGREIWATWPNPATLEDASAYLLGPVLGVLLRLRGVTCLHASAVALDGQAVAIVGSEGAGKSTAAAAFAREGYAVLSDDVVALTESEARLLVQPAYPHLCLWPDSVAALYGSAGALPHFSTGWEKHRLALGGGENRFQDRPLPLGAIYFLRERRSVHAPSLEVIGARAAFLSLVADTFANKLLDRELRAREFDLLGRMVMTIPARRVFPHSDPARVPELCRVIREDFALLSASTTSIP